MESYRTESSIDELQQETTFSDAGITDHDHLQGNQNKKEERGRRRASKRTEILGICFPPDIFVQETSDGRRESTRGRDGRTVAINREDLPQRQATRIDPSPSPETRDSQKAISSKVDIFTIMSEKSRRERVKRKRNRFGKLKEFSWDGKDQHWKTNNTTP